MEQKRKSESPSPPYRIFLLDDHALMRAGLSQLLAQHPEYVVTGEAGSGEEFFRKAKDIEWDLLIVDLSMPGTTGFDVLKKISEKAGKRKILVLTLHDSEEYLKLAFRYGANGYGLKDDSPEELMWLIREVRNGRKAVSRKLKDAMFDRKFMELPDKNHVINILSPRELEVLRELASGKRSREIARVLDISDRTVEKHRASIMAKLETDNLATLIKLAIEHKLI